MVDRVMTGRIITVRHGQPDLSRDIHITAKEYGAWWAKYDASGLVPGQTPADALYALASQAHTVLSSTLPRSVETAKQLTGGTRHVPADVIFVEAPLPPPPVPLLRLRPGTWGVISRSFWFWGYTPTGVESHLATWRRVAEIVDRLVEHARDGDVMLCAHGYLNWMIDRRLKKVGWNRSSRHGANDYWSWRVYDHAEMGATQPTAQAAE